MKVCNNVDHKCYTIKDHSSLDNDISDMCYLPTACPQNVNTPYEWIFQLPTPYTSIMEFNDYIADYCDNCDLEWIF